LQEDSSLNIQIPSLRLVIEDRTRNGSVTGGCVRNRFVTGGCQMLRLVAVALALSQQLQRYNGIYFGNTKLRSKEVQSTRDYIQMSAKLHVTSELRSWQAQVRHTYYRKRS
jgi:hypothetical protein